MTRRLIGLGVLLAAIGTAGCAASKTLRKNDAADKTVKFKTTVA